MVERLIPKEPTKFDQIERWARFVKDLGLIIGIPALLVIGIQLNNARVDALEAQIQLLEEQSVVSAAVEVRAYRDLLEAQGERLKTQIDSLRNAGVEAEAIIDSLSMNLIRFHTSPLRDVPLTSLFARRLLVGLYNNDLDRFLRRDLRASNLDSLGGDFFFILGKSDSISSNN